MVTKITTKTGAVYKLHDGLWKKNGGPYNRTWSNFCVSNETLENAKTWDDVHNSEHLPIQVGLCMYIAGRDEWYLSTPIVSIEETDDPS